MKRVLVISFVAIVAAFVIIISTRFDRDAGVPKANALREEVNSLHQEKEKLTQELYILNGRLDALDSDDSHVQEQIIRSQLNLIHDDEVLIDLSGVNKK